MSEGFFRDSQNLEDDLRTETGRGNRTRIRSAALRCVAFAILSIMLLAGGAALYQESLVHRARIASLRPPAEASVALTETWASKTLPPRAAMLRALISGRAAFISTDPVQRRTLVESARHDLAVAYAARPVWADADVVRTYIELVAAGASAPAARSAFADSYRSAPFLEDSALWRVTYGGNQWFALDEATRTHVIDEALWYRYRSRGKDSVLLPALGGGEAEHRYRAAISAAAIAVDNARLPRS